MGSRRPRVATVPFHILRPCEKLLPFLPSSHPRKTVSPYQNFKTERKIKMELVKSKWSCYKSSLNGAGRSVRKSDLHMSQPVWNLIFDLIVSSRTPSKNSRYVQDSYHKITYDSLSTYLRIQYLSDHYPKRTHNSLRTNILLFVLESVTSVAR